MPESPTVVPYEPQREPPYLLREPGRVVLVLSPVPRWLGAIMVVMHAACCVLLTVFAFMYVHTLRNSILIRPPGTAAILTFLVGLPVGCIAFLAFQVRWWLRTSREQPVLEIRGDELLWSFPGFWATKLRRAPLESVRGVSLRAARTIGTLHAARVRVDFTNGRRLERPFFSGDPAFAEEVREAFAAAIGGARGQTQ